MPNIGYVCGSVPACPPNTESLQNFTDSQWTWLGNSAYRMHRFRSSASAIKGLTAEILVSVVRAHQVSLLAHCADPRFPKILTATVAYDRKPSYPRYAPGQLTTFKALLEVLDPEYFTELRKSAEFPQVTTEGVVYGRE